MKSILLVEDDQDLGMILQQYMSINDLEVTWVMNGREALEILDQGTVFDLAVLDVMMPEMDGFTLAEKVRERFASMPFIFLTARKMKEDMIKGLQLGADDYIVKPFDADVLVLKINNLLHRFDSMIPQAVSHDKIQIGKYIFDTKNLLLNFQDEQRNLSEREAKLISLFVANKNQLVKRETLLNHVWGDDDFFSGRSMDVFVTRLRKYFKNDEAIKIKSTRGVGLTFFIDS
ncbi:response regulator transcription factor [Aureibacter tunicatorum]|uniref:DNA-binding response OmpR family regulator n=1 Tax=Aureibacter tunicatorum TaxID=866807 RepID=A0AAE4BUC4_9BACT|nr:response regulator transcription factor [Aureibacter tunicatorum]MDR6240582.1 DNA-binding response OmpR family regulator [Aureibacter tunicatorum]BDD06557.1 DNA-binding response regulator [Aureibacter tunicatorum]